jgi:hypothetical protein
MSTLLTAARINMRLFLAVLMLSVTSGLMAQPQTPSLQEQAICAKQAKVAFEDYNDYNRKLAPNVKSTGDYQSHYNTKLNKCLIKIEMMILGDKDITN